MKVHPRTAIAALAITLPPLATTPALAGVAPTMTDRLLPAGVDPTDEFAASLDIDGDIAVVGAPLDDELGADAGAAYVYRRSGGEWMLETKLLASDGAAGDEFGRGVAVSSGRIVINAAEADADQFGTGALYTFEYENDSWTESDVRPHGDPSVFRIAGASISMDGDLLAASTYLQSGPGVSATSAMTLYRWSGGAWATEHVSSASGVVSIPGIKGPPVCVQGDVAVVGDYGAESPAGNEAGLVRIVQHDGNGWNEVATLTGSQLLDEEGFGWSVDLDGDTLVVGTIRRDALSFYNRAVYVFVDDGASWTNQTELHAGPAVGIDLLPQYNGFGFEVSISGDRVLVCDRWNHSSDQDDPDTDRSAAYLYQRTGGTWDLVQPYLIDEEGQFERFGGQIVLDGKTALIGNNRTTGVSSTPSAAFIVNLCGADLNGDGLTDSADLGLLIDQFGNEEGGVADINNDGAVDTADLGVLVREFGESCF